MWLRGLDHLWLNKKGEKYVSPENSQLCFREEKVGNFLPGRCLIIESEI